MSTDDVAEAKSVPITSPEPNNTSQTSTDPSSATSRQQPSLSTDQLLPSDESGPFKLAENGHIEPEANEIESRDITEASEAVDGDLEVVGGSAEPSSEPFMGSGDSSEVTESAEGVVAWSPEEDHEHKRVKVR